MEDSERLHAIWLATVEKLKDVVREFRVTQDELHAAGRYFNRLGQSAMCPSLIDVALAMTSVDVTAGTAGGTRPNLDGPYHATHPLRPNGSLLDRDPEAGAHRLTLQGTVTDVASGRPLQGVELDFWQADSRGLYDREGHHLRGIVTTDAAGRYGIETVVPADYAEHDGDPIGELFRAMHKENTRAAHIHIKASINGRLVLTTQVFMDTSNYLDRDYVEGAVTDDLIVAIEPDPADPERRVARFDIALAGASQRAVA